MAYEGPHGAQADYSKAVQIISSYEESFLSKRRKGVQETTMFAKAAAHGSRGDAPLRAQGGGDARPRSVREPCVHFLQGKCKRGARCRFRHIQTPNKNGDRRIFNSPHYNKDRRTINTGRRQGNRQPARRHQGSHQPFTCFNCGLPGHLKRDCRKQKDDFAKTAVDFALPVVELHEPAQDRECDEDMANVADGQQHEIRGTSWLIDGGATCHVLGFDRVRSYSGGDKQTSKSLSAVDRG